MGKRNRSRNSIMLGLLAVLMLFVTACGGNSAGSTNNAGSSGTEPTITLTMMHPWTTPNVDNEVYKERIAEFEKQHPNIIIKQDGVPSAQYKTKLRTLAAANNLADINVIWPGADLAPLAAGNLLQPINDMMDNWGSILPEYALSGFNVDGQQYAIPTKQNFVDIIYYNKEMFAQVGYDQFPDTYEGFIDVITKLKEAGITPISLGNKEQWPLQSTYVSGIGDRFTGSDFLPAVLEGKAKFTDPDFVKALAVIDELTKLGAFNTDANNMDSVQSQDYLIQGKAAMHISSATVDGRIRMNNEEGDKFGIALLPSFEGGKGDPKKSAGIMQFGIGIKSGLDEQKLQAAQEFLKFFVSEDLYKELARNGVVVPAKIEVPEDASPYLKEMLTLTSNGMSPVFDSLIPAQVVDVLQNGLQSMMMGRTTPEELAEEVQKALDDMN